MSKMDDEKRILKIRKLSLNRETLGTLSVRAGFISNEQKNRERAAKEQAQAASRLAKLECRRAGAKNLKSTRHCRHLYSALSVVLSTPGDPQS